MHPIKLWLYKNIINFIYINEILLISLREELNIIHYWAYWLNKLKDKHKKLKLWSVSSFEL